MHSGIGQISEILLQNGQPAARLSCPKGMIPSPGQYLLAGNASPEPLPVPVMFTGSAPGGFIAAPVPEFWKPGLELILRGPLGRGFVLPVTARKVGLIAYDDPPARLNGLIGSSLMQGAAVVLVCESLTGSLAEDVEVQPLSALMDIVKWADYLAFDVARENLPRLKEMLGAPNQWSVVKEAQVLIRTAIPCGGIAECGVCSVVTGSGWKMICKDGPVFDWAEI